MTERVEIELNVDDGTAEFLRGVAELSTVSLDDVVSVMLAAYLKRMDQVSEGCTPTDAKVLREANHELARDWAAARHDNAIKDEEIAAANGKIAKLEADNASLHRAIMNMATEKLPTPADDRCPDCHGFGEVCLAGHGAHRDNWSRCVTCNGSGKKSITTSSAYFHPEQIRAAAHAEFMDMREDNVSPMKFVRAVLKRLTGVDEK